MVSRKSRRALPENQGFSGDTSQPLSGSPVSHQCRVAVTLIPHSGGTTLRAIWTSLDERFRTLPANKSFAQSHAFPVPRQLRRAVPELSCRPGCPGLHENGAGEGHARLGVTPQYHPQLPGQGDNVPFPGTRERVWPTGTYAGLAVNANRLLGSGVSGGWLEPRFECEQPGYRNSSANSARSGIR